MLFVQNYYEQMLGIMQISAVLKQNGFTTDVILGTKEDIVKKILAKNRGWWDFIAPLASTIKIWL